MYTALSPGAAGIRSNDLTEILDAAAAGGFQGCEVSAESVLQHGAESVKSALAERNLRAAGCGVPDAWRRSTEEHAAAVAALPAQAAALAAIGITRAPTYIMPMSDERAYEENYAWHVERLTPFARIYADHGIQMGLEFIGPKTLRDLGKFPFIHDIPRMLQMAADMGPNVGLLVDCFHWYTSGGNEGELAGLRAKDIVYVHVNDAVVGRSPDEQIDNQREMPASTGVIDIAFFLRTLRNAGYDGPVVPEPFKDLSGLASDADRARAVGEPTAHAMKLAFGS